VNGFVYAGCDNAVAVFGTSISTSKCFIATALEGDESPRVLTLRTFRDEYLLKDFFGRRFVALYEKFSPSFAAILRKRKWLRRTALALIVFPGFLLAKGVLMMKKLRGS
jgi:hypothetical protein